MRGCELRSWVLPRGIAGGQAGPTPELRDTSSESFPASTRTRGNAGRVVGRRTRRLTATKDGAVRALTTDRRRPASVWNEVDMFARGSDERRTAARGGVATGRATAAATGITTRPVCIRTPTDRDRREDGDAFHQSCREDQSSAATNHRRQTDDEPDDPPATSWPTRTAPRITAMPITPTCGDQAHRAALHPAPAPLSARHHPARRPTARSHIASPSPRVQSIRALERPTEDRLTPGCSLSLRTHEETTVCGATMFKVRRLYEDPFIVEISRYSGTVRLDRGVARRDRLPRAHRLGDALQLERQSTIPHARVLDARRRGATRTQRLSQRRQQVLLDHVEKTAGRRRSPR